MTSEEKEKFLTEKIKLMLDDIDYGITRDRKSTRLNSSQ